MAKADSENDNWGTDNGRFANNDLSKPASNTTLNANINQRPQPATLCKTVGGS